MRKNYLLLFIAIIGIGLSSCKKDKVIDKPALVSNDISGNWKLASAIDEYIFGEKSVISVNHPLPADTIDHINFKADGTGVMMIKGVAVTRFKYDATDSVIHFTDVFDNATDNYIGTGAFVLFITKVDNSKMQLTGKWFPYGVYFYGNDRFDQIQYHYFYNKEN
ncbi:hypothetical protein [Mucilaginibacter aquariorum]|uniref:DUF5004 domain-containing protein n=1 Tax=Mucilaginibacter aquariorum TaxID=2967225 RepID=A0ABT1SZU0_9SPHI|nr:hypothetical protein [Mucilaginibacter aquariorum]MCQ6957248.1 hypothetical protein [Mucilaginibacter aquariorum]